MADSETLRPEVRKAFGVLDTWLLACCGTEATKAWQIIRAELLRLAMIEADALIALDCEHDWQVEHERAERAEAELADAQRMFWCLLHSHKAPLIVHRDAMVSYHKQTAELVRRDLPNGDIEFQASVREDGKGNDVSEPVRLSRAEHV